VASAVNLLLFLFTGILRLEIAIAVAKFLICEPPRYDFVTATPLSLFLIEGIVSARSKTKKQLNKQDVALY
jgi:hypothetical protein